MLWSAMNTSVTSIISLLLKALSASSLTIALREGPVEAEGGELAPLASLAPFSS